MTNPWFWGVVGDAERPSFFELVVLSRLENGISPAINYFIQVMRRYSTLFELIAQFRPEIRAIMGYYIEKHYLETYASSFAEHMYGLRRISVSGGGYTGIDSHTISGESVRLSLLCLVALPYLRSKIHQLFMLFSEHTDGASVLSASSGFFPSFSNPSSQDSLTTASTTPFYRDRQRQRTYQRMGEIFNGIWKFIKFFYEFSYLLRRGMSFSPTLAFCGLSLRRLTASDRLGQQRDMKMRRAASVAAATAAESLARQQGGFTLFRFRFMNLLHKFTKKSISSLQLSLLFITISFKFIEWYNAPTPDNNNLGSERNDFRPPPPIKMQIRQRESVEANETQNKQDLSSCGLCYQKRYNPAASPDGVLYCYPCIFRYVEKHGCCPNSGVACTIEQIRKLTGVS